MKSVIKCILQHDPDSISTGTKGLIPPTECIFIGWDRCSIRFNMAPLPPLVLVPISTASASIEVNGELKQYNKKKEN